MTDNDRTYTIKDAGLNTHIQVYHLTCANMWSMVSKYQLLLYSYTIYGIL